MFEKSMIVRYEPFKIEIDYNGRKRSGKITPYYNEFDLGLPNEFNVIIDNDFMSVVSSSNDGWLSCKKEVPQDLIDMVGMFIFSNYNF